MGFWRIAKKDLILLGRDRRALATLLVMPLIFIAILGLTTGQMLGWRNENELITLAVVNQDKGPLSQDLVANLKKRDGVSVKELTDVALARQKVHDGDYTAAVTIAPDFATKVDELRPSDAMDFEHGELSGGVDVLGVEVDAEGATSNTRAIVRMIVQGETLRTIIIPVLQKNRFMNQYIKHNILEAEPSATAEQEKTSKPKESHSSSSYGSAVYQTIVPGYTVMFTFFLVTIMARSFLAEWELGTLRRLLTTPVGVGSLMLGKTIPFFFISVAQGMLLFLCGRLMFGMSWGTDPVMLLPIIACTSMAATGLGLLVATLVHTDTQVTSFGTLTVITMAGISGCFMPRQWMPELMRQISLATPHAWALIAYDQLLTTTRPNLSWVWESCGILCLFAVLFFFLGCLRFRFS